MNKYLTIFLGVIVFTSVNAGVLKSEKQQQVSRVYTKILDETVGVGTGSIPKI